MDRKNTGLKPGNINFQRALQGETQNVPPIWMMRQAGRYHKHYQNYRKKHSFEELCKIPELASEIALGPVMDFDFDLAILFSDILFPLDCLGMGLQYTDSGPVLEKHLTIQNINSLTPANDAVQKMQFQREAMRLTREKLPSDKSLIGFVGGIWTLFCYAVDGKHSGNLYLPKKKPGLITSFFNLMDTFIKENIKYQLEGGAEVVMILDTAAGELSPQEFGTFILPSIRSIAKEFPKKLGYYCKNCTEEQLNLIKSIPEISGIGFDHRINLVQILKQNKTGFIQGNFDQSLLFREKKDFIKTLESFLKPILELSPNERKGWICGLGHGILPKTPESNVRLFVETVRKAFN